MTPPGQGEHWWPAAWRGSSPAASSWSPPLANLLAAARLGLLSAVAPPESTWVNPRDGRCKPCDEHETLGTWWQELSPGARRDGDRIGDREVEPITSDAPVPVTDRAGLRGRVGPLATFVNHVGQGGRVVRWGSRRHRKHLKDAAAAGSTWWAPRARGWWIAILFAVGSLLFGLGTVPAYASAVGAGWDLVTFFIGSLFFTSAAFLSYREAVDAAPQALNPVHRRFFVYQPGRIDWWATAVQLAGTLYFNVSCGTAMVTGLSAQAAHRHVWWITPGILEALIPGRIQGHGGTTEVP